MIGLILSVVHTCWVVNEELVLRHVSSTDYSLVPTVIGLLFGLLLVNGLLNRVAPRWMLAPAELMVIFVMTTISAIVNGQSFTQNLFPLILWPKYLGAGNRDFNQYIAHIPSFFAPQSDDLVKEMFVGSHERWRFFQPEVLKAWLVPMAFWGGYLFLLIWTMFSIGFILRKQWVDREKLNFPIIDLPVAMVREGTAGALFRDKLFAIGFGISFLVLSMNYLSGIFPAVPCINLNAFEIGKLLFVSPPATGMTPIVVCWWPYAIGLAYLIPLDISFSCWFFYVLIRVSMLLATMFGLRDAYASYSPDQFPYFQTISQGAWVGMFMAVMWGAKGHLAQVWKAVKEGRKAQVDSEEPLSYRMAFLSVVAGGVGLVTMMMLSGMRLQVALLFFAICFMAVTAMTRIYAQIAVPQFSMGIFYSTTSFVTSLTGTSGLTKPEAATLTSLYWSDFTYRQHPMGHGMESMVFADRLKQSKRTMSRIVFTSLILGIIVGMTTVMQIFYYHGAASAQVSLTPSWLGGVTWSRLLTWNASPKPVEFMVIMRMVVSAAIVLLLSWARNMWFGFPLHPVGYLFASCFAVEWIWNILLVTWAIKALVIRYGGLKLYQRSLPFFFGIALGDAVAQLVWGLILGILGVPGPTPYGPGG